MRVVNRPEKDRVGEVGVSSVTVETKAKAGRCGSGCDRGSKENEQRPAPEGCYVGSTLLTIVGFEA